jgi:hypothetical protein
MMRSRLAGLPALLALLALTICSPACDDCDSCCITFTSTTLPAPGTVASVKSDEATCELLAVDLIITDVDELFQAEFTVLFDAEIATYEGMSADGSILGSDGTQTVVLEDPQPGEVTVAITRLGGLFGGIDAEGEQFLARLYFGKAAEAGSTALSLDPTRLFGLRPGQFQPYIIQDVSWSGGTILIR